MGDVETPRFSRGGRKSEVITIRLDPRLKYLAELAARRQRRPLSSYVEWSIEESLKHVRPSYESSGYGEEPSFADVASSLWDVDEADRFAMLALTYPDLLTHDEQILWKHIRECGAIWRGKFGHDDAWQWQVEPADLIKERLREHWDTFRKVAANEAPASSLPTWLKKRAPVPKKESPPDLDDDIPF
jgi:hypothetical protein